MDQEVRSDTFLELNQRIRHFYETGGRAPGEGEAIIAAIRAAADEGKLNNGERAQLQRNFYGG